MSPRPPDSHPAITESDAWGSAALVSCLAMLVLAPCMVGTVHSSTTAALACLAVAALWCVLLSGARVPPTLLGGGLLLVGAWIAATCIPLPAGLTGAVAPAAAELWASPLVATRPSLSCAPGPSLLEVLEITGAVAAFGATCALWHQPRYRRALLVGLIVSGVLVAVLSGLQTVFGGDRILWMYTPASASSGALRTPFVNANHAAQFFELTGLVALGAAATSKDAWRAWLGMAGVLALGAALATGSGGARFIVPAGVALVIAMALSRRRAWLRWIVPGASALAIGIGAGAVVMGRSGTLLLGSGKVAHLPAVLQMIRDHPLVGVGRGAFRDVFAGYDTPGGFVRYTHAESEPLHLIAELGVPIASALIVVTLITWVLAVARWRGDPVVAGASAGVFGVGLHSVLEFGLEFGGVGLPFVVACAALTGQTGSTAAPRRLPRGVGLGLAALVTSGLLVTPVALRHGSWNQERGALEGARTESALDQAITRALRWHPNSPDVTLLSASALLDSGRSAEALRFLNRSMVLDPHNPVPHLVAAHTLARTSADGQAALEASVALQLDPTLGHQVFPLLASLVRGPDEALRYLRFDLDQAAAFAQYLMEHHPQRDDGRELGMRIAARDPENPAAARLLASMEWSSGRQGEALARLREASEAHPCDVKLVKYDAALRRSAGDVQGALDVVDGCLECNGPLVELLYQQAASYIELGDYPSTHGAVRGMRAVATNPSSLALVAATEGDLAAAQGHWLRAKGHYLESLRLRPDRVHVRLALGKVYRELDRDRDALEQFERVRQQTSAYPFLDDWIRDLEAALAAEEAEASDG